MKRLRDILQLDEMATVSFPLKTSLTKMNDYSATVLKDDLKAPDGVQLGNIMLGGRNHDIYRINTYSDSEYKIHALYPSQNKRNSRMAAITLNTEKFSLPSSEPAITVSLVRKHKDADHFRAAEVYSWLTRHGHLENDKTPPQRGLAVVSDTIMSPATQANYNHMFRNQEKYGIQMTLLHPEGHETPINSREDFEKAFIYRSTNPSIVAGGNLSTKEKIDMGNRRIVLRTVGKK